MQSAQATRREFLGTAAAAAAALAFPATGVRAAAKFKRSIVTSPEGQKALASYKKGVEAMLKLPADDPRNWFRTAFIHLMDCPHGNWWFYVWHRGYLGYFEQTIRSLSDDPDFALPYWDWTQLPQIPDSMFDGVLTPTDSAFEPYTSNLEVFTDFIKPALETYWNGLSAAQKAQLQERGYQTFDDDDTTKPSLWNGPSGVTGGGNAGTRRSPSRAARATCRGPIRSLIPTQLPPFRDFTVAAGLLAPKFYDPTNFLSFTSLKTPNHQGSATTPSALSVIEG